MRINNPLSACECAATGLGLTAAPASIARSLGLRRVGPLFGRVGIWVVTTASVARLPRVRAFVKHLVSAFQSRQEIFQGPPLSA